MRARATKGTVGARATRKSLPPGCVAQLLEGLGELERRAAAECDRQHRAADLRGEALLAGPERILAAKAYGRSLAFREAADLLRRWTS